jgi:hypothetical protein
VLRLILAFYICVSSAAVHLQSLKSSEDVAPQLAHVTEKVPPLSLTTDEVLHAAYRARSSEIAVHARRVVVKHRNRRMEPPPMAHWHLVDDVVVVQKAKTRRVQAPVVRPSTVSDVRNPHTESQQAVGASAHDAPSHSDPQHTVDGDGPLYRDEPDPRLASGRHQPQRQVLQAADGPGHRSLPALHDDERHSLLNDIHSSELGRLFHPAGSDPATPDASAPCSSLSGCAGARSAAAHAPGFIRRWLSVPAAAALGGRHADALLLHRKIDGLAYSRPFGALGLFSGAAQPTGVKAGFSLPGLLR